MGDCLSKGGQKEAEPKPKDAEENVANTEEDAEKPDDDSASAAKPEESDERVENGAAETEQTPATETVAETPAQSPDEGGKPVVFVLGASGSIGSATVRALSEEYADKVEIRAGVRNPEGADKLKELSGVELVQASMADKDGLVPVLSGVSSLYIVTPGVENRQELVALAADAAKEAGVKHVVVVSGTTSGLDDLFGRNWTSIEDKVIGLGIPHTIIRLPYFLDNLLANAASIREKDQFSLPIHGDKPYTVIDVSDAGKASAAVLADPSKHEGKIYNIVSVRVTNDGIVAALSSILEKEVGYVYMDFEDAKSSYETLGLSEWQITGTVELFRLIEEGDPQINVENIGDFKEITGKNPTSLEEYLTSHAAMFK